VCASVAASIVSSNSSSTGKRPGLLCQMLRLCTVLATQPMGYGGGNGSMPAGNGTMGYSGPMSGGNGTWPSNSSSSITYSPMPSNYTVKPSRHLLQYSSPTGYTNSSGPMPYGNTTMGYPGPGGPYPGPGGYYGYPPVDPITAMAQMVQDMQYQLGARGSAVRVLADVGTGCPPTLVASTFTGILGAVDLCSTDGTMAGPAAPGVLPPAGECPWFLLYTLCPCQSLLQQVHCTACAAFSCTACSAGFSVFLQHQLPDRCNHTLLPHASMHRVAQSQQWRFDSSTHSCNAVQPYPAPDIPPHTHTLHALPLLLQDTVCWPQAAVPAMLTAAPASAACPSRLRVQLSLGCCPWQMAPGPASVRTARTPVWMTTASVSLAVTSW
jgi:hypothetical protein